MRILSTILVLCLVACSTNHTPTTSSTHQERQSYEVAGIQVDDFDSAVQLGRDIMDTQSTRTVLLTIPKDLIQEITIPRAYLECTELLPNGDIACENNSKNPTGCGASIKVSDKWFTLINACDEWIHIIHYPKIGINVGSAEILYKSLVIGGYPVDVQPFFMGNFPEASPDEGPVPESKSKSRWLIIAQMIQEIDFGTSGCQYSNYTPGLVDCHDGGGEDCHVRFKISDKWFKATKECNGTPILATFGFENVLYVMVYYDTLTRE